MTEAKKYTGGCHCGKVRYEVTADLSQPVLACNCSICNKTGALLTFVPAGAFTVLAGGDALVDYQFNKMNVHHLFCPTCGIRSFAHGENPPHGTMYAVNVRCLDDVDISTLTLRHFDGKSL